MDSILAQARKLFGSQAIAIYRLQNGDDEGITRRKQHIPGKKLADLTTPQQALKQALRTRQPVTVPCTPPHFSAYEKTEAQRDVWMLPSCIVYQALLAVPIVIKQQMYGGVLLYYTEPRRYLVCWNAIPLRGGVVLRS